jgi:hypothetical protein
MPTSSRRFYAERNNFLPYRVRQRAIAPVVDRCAVVAPDRELRSGGVKVHRDDHGVQAVLPDLPDLPVGVDLLRLQKRRPARSLR